ncbi:M48 family metalloprotease [Tsuneonella sp. HG222]
MRLLTVADRMQVANAALCDRLSPALGASLQSKDQFEPGQDPGFRADVAFALVSPGGLAAANGISDNDGLVAIDGQPVRQSADLAGNPLRDSAHAMLAAHDMTKDLTLTIEDVSGRRQVTLRPRPECRALVEVVAREGTIGRSDGRVIQLSQGLIERTDDNALAVIFAHELAHSVLRHRDRLTTLGVSKGLAGEFGRDRHLNAEAEIEADRLSVHLLANAGFDPRIAPQFWRSGLGRQIGGGVFRSRVYASPEGRAEQLELEIARYLATGAPSWPGHLLSKR